jgi:spermidine synthase
MAIASDALDPAAADATTLQARAAERHLEGLRYYDAQLHAALLKAALTARDKLGELLQLY